MKRMRKGKVHETDAETDASFLKRMRADMSYFKAAEESVGEVDVPDFRRLVRLAAIGASRKASIINALSIDIPLFDLPIPHRKRT